MEGWEGGRGRRRETARRSAAQRGVPAQQRALQSLALLPGTRPPPLTWLNSTTRCPRALSLASSRSSTWRGQGGGRGRLVEVRSRGGEREGALRQRRLHQGTATHTHRGTPAPPAPCPACPTLATPASCRWPPQSTRLRVAGEGEGAGLCCGQETVRVSDEEDARPARARAQPAGSWVPALQPTAACRQRSAPVV